jgi:hypothetical protein
MSAIRQPFFTHKFLTRAAALLTASAGLMTLGCGGEETTASEAPVSMTPAGTPVDSPVGSVMAPSPAIVPGPGSAPPAGGADPSDALIGEDDDEVPAGGGFLPSERVDLLFVIDNSSSMADKQEVFKAAIPDLIDQMVNPPCVVTETQEFRAYDEAAGGCGSDARRIFGPVNDIHIAMISSSLGPLGTEGTETPLGCDDLAEENDRSWLLGRIRPELTADSYQNWGFLVWDPKAQAVPPGESDLATLIAKFEAQVNTIGELGCGFEAPLEAAYRFLSDPDPYESLQRANCPGSTSGSPLCVEPVGVDMDLLAQREQFLRPDSVVVVIFLTDENDCSLRAKGQGFRAMSNLRLRGGTAACDANPNDMCCRPCGTGLPEGCDADPATNGCAEDIEDDFEARPLRCFDQQRRFGVSFLRSTDVYIGGYTNTFVADRNGEGQPNALFTEERGREKIFVVGIIGVPWQDTSDPAKQTEATFDLIESREVDWSLFLPTDGNHPTDPFNIEAMGMRTGSHPVTDDVLGGPGTWNAINGHDRALYQGDGRDDDLQYSCIFELPAPRDCVSADLGSCDCVSETDPQGNVINHYEGNPLCFDETTAAYGQTQYYAKAYPGPRLLEVLRGVSCTDADAECTDQSVLASICPRQFNDETRQDFGYRPVIRALLLNLVSVPAK